MSRLRSTPIQIAISVIVVVLVFGFLLPRMADYDEAWDAVLAMSWTRAALLATVAVWSLVSYLPLLVAVLPGLRLREAAVSNFASTAVSNTLPGGGAIGVGVTVTIQRSYGIGGSDIALGAVVSGVWNNFAKLALPVLALVLLAVTGESRSSLTIAASIGLGVLGAFVIGCAMLLRREGLAARLGSWAERPTKAIATRFRRRGPSGWGDAAVGFRARTIGLVRDRWRSITIATIVSHLSLYLVLLVSLRAIGLSEHQVGWIEALAAFSFVRLLSALPISPGGLGVVELGLTTWLSDGLSPAATNQVAAAVLVFRALTWFVPIPLGIAAWTFWRSNRSWRQAATQHCET